MDVLEKKSQDHKMTVPSLAAFLFFRLLSQSNMQLESSLKEEVLFHSHHKAHAMREQVMLWSSCQALFPSDTEDLNARFSALSRPLLRMSLPISESSWWQERMASWLFWRRYRKRAPSPRVYPLAPAAEGRCWLFQTRKKERTRRKELTITEKRHVPGMCYLIKSLNNLFK